MIHDMKKKVISIHNLMLCLRITYVTVYGKWPEREKQGPRTHSHVEMLYECVASSTCDLMHTIPLW